MITYRPACEQDLARCSEIVYLNEIRGNPSPPPMPTTSATMAHILRTGTVVVAEEDEAILGYAGAITRDTIAYLTDLFVHPDRQSTRLGQTLLQHVLPETAGQVRCTMSSTDPRALALYIRAGMRPQWPNFCLRLDDATSPDSLRTDVEIVEADLADPVLVDWDAHLCGRRRPHEHAFWTQEQRAIPLWFRSGVETLGYGYVRLGAGTFWSPEACVLGPLGVRSSTAATTCVLAMADWARQHAKTLRIDVPGPHPSLAPLLEAGFRIAYVETHLSSAPTPFYDSLCSIASGSDLF